MFRQITISNYSLHNIKLLSKQILPEQNISSNQRKFHYFINKKENPKICGGLDNQIVRFNSSQQINTELTDGVNAQKKKHKYGKYVELLQVGLTTKQIKARVRSLKSKKLSEFIEKSDYLENRFSGKYLVSQLTAKEKENMKQIAILNKEKEKLQNAKNREKQKLMKSRSNYSKKSSFATSLLQPIEYQKFDIDMFENSLNQFNDCDTKPLIFLGNEDIHLGSKEHSHIITSFNNFKEMIDNIKCEQDDESIYVPRFSKDSEVTEGIESIDNITDPLNVSEIEKLHSSANLNESQNLKSKNIKQKTSKYHKSLEHEKLAKYKSIMINLTTYINVCITNGMLNRALSTILVYREKIKKFKIKNPQFETIPVDTYNILLHGYAKNGDLNKIENIFKYFKEDNLKPNSQTFAAIFECLGRVEESSENKNLLLKYRNKAEKYGIQLNDIVDKSKFQYDELEIILDAIRRIEPEFNPTFTKPILNYSNELLSSLNNEESLEIEAVKGDYSKEDLHKFAKEQLKIELDGSVTIKSIEKSSDFPNSEIYRKKIEDLNSIWRSQIYAAINRDLNALRAQMRYKPNGIMTYYIYLKTLDPKQYADILLQEIKKLGDGSETYSPTVGQLYRELGQKVQAKYQIEIKKQNGLLDKTGELYTKYCENLENGFGNQNTRKVWQTLIHENRINGPSMDVNDVVWPTNVLTGVGRFLYNILMRDIKIDSNIFKHSSNTKKNLLPAFYTLYRNHGRIVKEEVKPHPILSKLIRASKQKTLTLTANQVPMLCPPQPWHTQVNGGYLLTKSDLIRLPYQAIQQWTRINEMPSENLYPALDSLNQLSSIAWRVNTNILDVIIEVFANGGDDKLDVPEAPSNLPPLPTISLKDKTLTSTEKANLFKQKMAHRRKQGEMYSLWCDTLYRLSLANHYRDKVFWLPHNMDFRGRVYPVPPHLNHLGSDLARSILIFDKKKPLGKDGLQWLKLHCINLTGLKKRDSIQDRLIYVEEIMDDILDSAENPLNGRKWWTKSDEPWQTLACCMEIAKVLKHPNPEEYMSGFPIHQDGSCNGLQHYAALGRDEAGAFSVNLSPSEKPQDVYSAIATLVEKNRKLDANNGLHVAQILDGYVRRKVIKQTVMTTVYGVTRYGARLQIARQLKDIDEFPKEWVWPASTYLTVKTFDSLREMFTSAKEIQDWFTDCARLISSICMQNVEWVTPLGLPVVQPYNRSELKSAKLARIEETLQLDMYERPNIMKQKNAFPPNFIHSLDSSHMMLTSLFCERNGVTFVSVHDCFWTHACTVPDMNKICREQFVALHSQPILEDLSKFLVDKYSFKHSNSSTSNNDKLLATKNRLNETLKQLPQKGNFDLNNILNSVYFFS